MVVYGDTYVGPDTKNYLGLLYLTDSEEMDLPKTKRFRGNEGWRHVCFSYILREANFINSQNQNAISRKI